MDILIKPLVTEKMTNQSERYNRLWLHSQEECKQNAD